MVPDLAASDSFVPDDSCQLPLGRGLRGEGVGGTGSPPRRRQASGASPPGPRPLLRCSPPPAPSSSSHPRGSCAGCPGKQEAVPAVCPRCPRVGWLTGHPGSPATVLRTPSSQSDKCLCSWGHTRPLGPWTCLASVSSLALLRCSLSGSLGPKGCFSLGPLPGGSAQVRFPHILALQAPGDVCGCPLHAALCWAGVSGLHAERSMAGGEGRLLGVGCSGGRG